MKWRGVSAIKQAASSISGFGPLRDQLIEIEANIVQYVQPEKRRIHERAIEELRAAGLPDRFSAIGDQLPAFALRDLHGKPFDSQELLKKSKLIVIFVRGRWCPFCVTTLEAWRDRSAEIQAAGAKLVAISPMTERQAAFTADQHKLPFPILCDTANGVARSFGLVYRVSTEQESLYRSVFINLPQQNGDDSWELPIPATIAVDEDGKILFAHADADYRHRAEPADVLRAIR